MALGLGPRVGRASCLLLVLIVSYRCQVLPEGAQPPEILSLPASARSTRDSSAVADRFPAAAPEASDTALPPIPAAPSRAPASTAVQSEWDTWLTNKVTIYQAEPDFADQVRQPCDAGTTASARNDLQLCGGNVSYSQDITSNLGVHRVVSAPKLERQARPQARGFT